MVVLLNLSVHTSIVQSSLVLIQVKRIASGNIVIMSAVLATQFVVSCAEPQISKDILFTILYFMYIYLFVAVQAMRLTN